MKKYKYLLFDLDGTLIYSHPGIFACFRYAFEKMGREVPKEKELYPVIGPSLFYSFTTFFGMTEEEAHRAVALYRERYSVKGVFENEPIEGVAEGLKTLYERGYTMALATSKPLVYAGEIADKHGFSAYFQEQVGGEFPTKAAVIAECLKRLGALPCECLMVGDRFYDAEGAKERGVDCALLKKGGYADEEELYGCGAQYVFDDFQALTAALTK